MCHCFCVEGVSRLTLELGGRFHFYRLWRSAQVGSVLGAKGELVKIRAVLLVSDLAVYSPTYLTE